jgi:hypothetical protein
LGKQFEMTDSQHKAYQEVAVIVATLLHHQREQERKGRSSDCEDGRPSNPWRLAGRWEAMGT